MGWGTIRFLGNGLEEACDDDFLNGVGHSGEEFPRGRVSALLLAKGLENLGSVVFWIDGESDELHITSRLLELCVEFLHPEHGDRARAFAAGEDKICSPNFSLQIVERDGVTGLVSEFESRNLGNFLKV